MNTLFLFSEVIEIPKNPDVPQWKAELVKTSELEDILTYATQMMYHDNKLYFSDVGQPAVVVYDLEGNYLKTIGQKGQGPGEMLQANYLWSEPDKGYFCVFDSGNRRTSQFDFEGKFLESETYEMNQNMFTTRLGDLDVNEVVHMSFDKKLLRHTRVMLDLQPEPKELYYAASHPAILGSYNHERPYFTVLDNKLFLTYVSTKDYNLKIFDESGNLIKEINKQCDRLPYTGEELKEEKEAAKQTEIRMKNNLTISKDIYGFHNINNNIYNDKENIWVVSNDAIGNYMDVYDTNGKLVAQCRGSEDDHFVKAHIQNGFIYALAYDDDNEMFMLKKYEIVK